MHYNEHVVSSDTLSTMNVLHNLIHSFLSKEKSGFTADELRAQSAQHMTVAEWNAASPIVCAGSYKLAV